MKEPASKVVVSKIKDGNVTISEVSVKAEPTPMELYDSLFPDDGTVTQVLTSEYKD